MKLRCFGAAAALRTLPPLSPAQTTGAHPAPVLPNAAALPKEEAGLPSKGQYAEAAVRYQHPEGTLGTEETCATGACRGPGISHAAQGKPQRTDA